MKMLLSAALAACALAAALALANSPAPAAAEGGPHLEGWVLKSLEEMDKVKAGMTRADLLKVFREEGGLSTRAQRTYVYRGCRYFKVDVRFEPAGNVEDRLAESPGDKITEISRPYVGREISD